MSKTTPDAVSHARAREELTAVADVLERLDALGGPMLRRTVPRLRRQLERLRHDQATLGTGLRPGGPPPQHLLEAASEERTFSAELLQEALTVYAGALVRAESLDRGMCALAELLLDDITAAEAEWAGLPILLGADDSFGSLSGVIRLRYPSDSVWGLPMVAHELGHHVALAVTREEGTGLRRRTRHPVEEMLDDEADIGGRNAVLTGNGTTVASTATSRWSHLSELFADVFATWTTGPAFACSLVMTRLDVSRPDAGSFQHPPPRSRYEAVVRTLRRMDDAEAAGPLVLRPNSLIADRLEQWWGSNAAPTPPRGALDALPGELSAGPGEAAFDHATVHRRLEGVLGLMARDFANVRLVTTGSARRIEHGLEREGTLVRSGDRVVDVLVGLWRARTNPNATAPPAVLARRAEALCRQLLPPDPPAPRTSPESSQP